ncbi:MAG: tetratricopeptide repeat protein [Chitinophagaceae bacterium]|nr:MAG: tetratricopeptide repeat protein [Chitinophagaceae bacterium]
MIRIIGILILLGCIPAANAQKFRADSAAQKLSNEKSDTARVINMWKTASYLYSYAPDSSIRIAQRAFFLAERIKYKEGESRSLGQMANGFLSLGNYPQALKYYLQKLQIEEAGSNPYNLASVTMNIGIVYVYREEYAKALYYLHRSDSIIKLNALSDLQFNINLNLGDLFHRQNNTDSAYYYFNRSLAFAYKLQDEDFIGTALTGLGHVYVKQMRYPAALSCYTQALDYLKKANNEDCICEAALGLAKLYEANDNKDSAVYFARYSFELALKDGFQSRQLDAATVLTALFKKSNDKDSALVYLEAEKLLGDSINSKEQIRASETISINEQIRQEEIAENYRRRADERRQQLQLLLIGLFIPILFLITVLLSRIKLPAKIIRFLGVISLLILFEYLTLLLHPRVVEFTHHTPFYELLIFVGIAALLIPAHHRIEHWLLKKLTIRKGTDAITIQKQKLIIKKLPAKGRKF